MKQICIECGKVIISGRARPRKYCSQACYHYHRLTMEHPNVADIKFKPINYVRIRQEDTIECIVVGCDWAGKHLSAHLYDAHGLYAKDVKKYHGFFMGRGLITPELSRKMGMRPQVLNTINRHAAVPRGENVKYYRNKAAEGAPMRRAVQARLRSEMIIIGKCAWCGKELFLGGGMGKKIFCCATCRHKANYRLNPKQYICFMCGKEFIGYSHKQGKIKVCSLTCRQRRAGMMARSSWPGDDKWIQNRI